MNLTAADRELASRVLVYAPRDGAVMTLADYRERSLAAYHAGEPRDEAFAILGERSRGR